MAMQNRASSVDGAPHCCHVRPCDIDKKVFKQTRVCSINFIEFWQPQGHNFRLGARKQERASLTYKFDNISQKSN